MTIAIRNATLDDAEAILAIYNHEVLTGSATFDVEPRTLHDQQRWLSDRSGGHVVLVAEVDGLVAGFGSLSAFKDRAAYRTTVENSVYVAADFQRRGLGRELLGELIERARQHGFHSVIARITGSNAGSVSLHEAAGFRVVGIEREIGRKFGRWLDVTEMQLMV